MAAAVSSLFPGTHLGIGPASSDGFFYDFQRDESFVEDDLPRIEERMRELVQKDLQYEPSIITKQEAIDYFSRQGEHLKVELIQEKAGETLRSEEHTSELQSPYDLVCRLLLEKKKKINK